MKSALDILGHEAMRLLSFALNLALITVLLKLAGWVPAVIQEGELRRYATLDEARRDLLFEPLTPSYFPQDLSWPPSTVIAQRRPYAAVASLFSTASGGDPGLVIVQSRSEHFSLDGALRLDETSERAVIDLEGRRATLHVGSCGGRTPCCRIAWSEDGWLLSVTILTGPVEALRLARSMMPHAAR